MKLARQWDVNYNGGVIRLTPVGEAEQIVIWQTSNITDQQHSGSATFSAPTTGGLQAWLNISNDGKINGGGYHGTTADSYLRCGDAQNNVETVGVQNKTLACRYGARYDQNGNPDPAGEATYTFENWTVEYDFSTYPFKSLNNLTRPEYSFGAYNGNHGADSNSSFNGSPATSVFPLEGEVPPVYYFVNEELVGATKGGRFAFSIGPECGNF